MLHLDSLKQCETPLNKLFFSAVNKDLIQRGIRQTFKNRTGIAIDYQNPDDLYSIMRAVFIGNSTQVQTGVSQYMAYAREIETIAEPIDRPVNTSTAGKKLPRNQIGM